ncbi:PREDICTED: zinc finger CCCH-type with G patch domain-containing protein-like [Acropora digitifera]|uniref:zinc finger CCCH-type with G patch domain-containing protein-like n=1 Tax=Acropora digitifera TaxID=70779 RepID=UPI00077A8A41|nr:PREDICTED: zinc finger CCCH-type with G patch domain-containing protein-like [Acropora digitifera]
MDEEALQQSLEQYKEQFLQIQNVLESTGEEGQNDLVKLRNDLAELIHVSEEVTQGFLRLQHWGVVEHHNAMVFDLEAAESPDEKEELKKLEILVILIQLLENEEETLCDSLARDEPSFASSCEDKNERDSVDDEDDITGMKCRVAFTHHWGVVEHHNAMVFDLEAAESPDEKEEPKVRVLFMNPTHKSMVPCPYFLQSNCRFSEETCRYSHGFLVSVEELMPFKEPDFSKVQCGQLCLARYDDGVWYKATIQSIDHDAHTFVVHYNTYNNSDATLGLDGIFPLDPRESESVSDDDFSRFNVPALNTLHNSSEVWLRTALILISYVCHLASLVFPQQLFKTQEEISAMEKQLVKEEMALSRHKDKDEKAASHFKEKVMAIKTHLSRLHQEEKGIQQKLNHKKNHRKLTVF